MNSSQKAIKYIALALALFLTIIIFSGIVQAGLLVIRVVYGWNDEFNKGETISQNKTYSEINRLSIENSVGELIIQAGSEFRVETFNVDEDIVCKNDNGTLKVIHNTDWISWLGFITETPKIIVTVPEGYELDEADIENKAGKITVSGLNADDLDIQSGAGEMILEDIKAQVAEVKGGAGKITITELTAEELSFSSGAGAVYGKEVTAGEVEIKGGAGDMKFTDCIFTNLELKSGVGKTTVTGKILGNSSVKCGVGETNLILSDPKDAYNLMVDSGIGSLKINGTNYSDVDGDNAGAQNTLKISGGVGSVNIDFED